MTDIPHFDLPFRFVNGHAAVSDQDSEKEITDCVVAAARTLIGQREERPDFGISDYTFKQQPLPVGQIVGEVLRNEDRGSMITEQSLSSYEKLAAVVIANVAAREATSD